MLFADADGPRAYFSNLLVAADRPRKCCSPTLADGDISRPKILRSAHHWLHAVFWWAATDRPFADEVKCRINAPHATPADNTGVLLLTLIIASDLHRPVLPPGRRPSPPSPTVGTVAQWPSCDGCCVWRKIEIASIIAIFCNNCIEVAS